MSQISQLSISLSLHQPSLPVIHPPTSLSTTKLAAWTLSWQKPICTISTCTRHKANVTAMFAKKRGGHYLPKVRFWTCRCARRLGRWAVWGSGQQLATHEHPQIPIPLCCSCLWISSDLNRLGPDSFSLINPQQSVYIHRTEWDRTASKIPVQLALLQV